MNSLVEANLHRDAAAVNRYHTQRTHRRQDLGQHSFNMMLLVHQVEPEARKEVLLSCMYHDLPELMTGDMRGDFKKMHVDIGVMMEEAEKTLQPLYRDFELTPEEESLVKWADRMEGLLWCLEEMRMGNAYVAEIAENYARWIESSRMPFKPVAFSPAADQLTMEVFADLTNLGGEIPITTAMER